MFRGLKNMVSALFHYPPQSEFNRIVAKEKIYQYAKSPPLP
jgi:hypothetical protein